MLVNTSRSSLALVLSYEALYNSCHRFMALEQGTPAEQKFFRGRIKNAKRFVAVTNSGGSFDFCPGAYVAFHDRKTLEQWEALGEKVYRGRGRAYLDQVLVQDRVESGSANYTNMVEAFQRFCDDRSIVPSKHTDPLGFWALSKTTGDFPAVATTSDKTDHWTDKEFEAAVKGYLEMLALEKAGITYNKNNVLLRLLELEGKLSNRTLASLNFRMRNISAILDELSYSYIKGYTPARHVGPAGKERITFYLEALGHIDTGIYLPTSDIGVLEERAEKLKEHEFSAPPTGNSQPARTERTATAYERLATVVTYVRQQAAGHCESCDSVAPFVTFGGELFLEVHHIRTLADGGSDTISNAVALCPNCHRRLHHGADRDVVKENLYHKIGRLVRE